MWFMKKKNFLKQKKNWIINDYLAFLVYYLSKHLVQIMPDNIHWSRFIVSVLLTTTKMKSIVCGSLTVPHCLLDL